MPSRGKSCAPKEGSINMVALNTEKSPEKPRQVRTADRKTARETKKITLRTPATRFEVDRSLIPDETDYVWRCLSIMGMENKENMVNAEFNGWTPVPASRHPEIVGTRIASETPNASIIVSGLVLMERPLELTRIAREMERTAADEQVAIQNERLQLAAKKNQATRALRLERTLESIVEE